MYLAVFVLGKPIREKTYFWHWQFLFLRKNPWLFGKKPVFGSLVRWHFLFLRKNPRLFGKKNLYWHIVLGNIGLVGPFSLGFIEVVHFGSFFVSRKNPWLFGKKPIFTPSLAVLYFWRYRL